MSLLERLLASADRLRALADDLTAAGDDVLADAARRAADTLDDAPAPDATESASQAEVAD